MKETVEMLLAARESAPERLRGLDFDGWMFGMIVNALAPVEREIVLWLMSDINPMDAARLAAVTGSTHYRVGAALSRLRGLGLVETTRYRGEVTHGLRGWARAGAGMWEQLGRERGRE